MVKKLFKSVHIYRSYRQNKPGGPFFWDHTVRVCILCVLYVFSYLSICLLFLFLYSSYLTCLLPSRIGSLCLQAGRRGRQPHLVFSLLCLFCVIVLYVHLALLIVLL